MPKLPVWLKNLENVTLFTLFKPSEFKIEKITSQVTQIRAGKSKVLVEIPNELIFKSEHILLDKKVLYISDIPTKKYSMRSYIMAILALQYDARIQTYSKRKFIQIDERVIPASSEELIQFDLSYEHGWKLSSEQLQEVLKLQKEIGEKAETIVFEYETEKLRKCKRTNLINKIRWTSKEDCTAGYDIQSFDQNGKLIYIEVKGTISDASNKFTLTENELKRAKKEGNAYYIYHVKNIHSDKPAVSLLHNPWKLIEEKSVLAMPSEYTVKYVINQFDKIDL